MTFANITIHQERDPSLPLLHERNAPTLQTYACCDGCGKPCQHPAKTEGAAVCLGLAAGWKYKIEKGFRLDGVFCADHLTGTEGKLYCPRCAFEEMLEEIEQ